MKPATNIRLISANRHVGLLQNEVFMKSLQQQINYENNLCKQFFIDLFWSYQLLSYLYVLRHMSMNNDQYYY